MLEQLIQLKTLHAPHARETTAEEIQQWFLGAGHELSWPQVVRLLKDEAVQKDLGDYVTGRRGHPSRFRWSDGLPGNGASESERAVSPSPGASMPRSADLFEVPTRSGRVVIIVEGSLRSDDAELVTETLKRMVRDEVPRQVLVTGAGEGADQDTTSAGGEAGLDADGDDAGIGGELADGVPRLVPEARLRRMEVVESLVTEAVVGFSVRWPRRAPAVVLRYGLDGTGEKTLEETGQRLDVTRERIRQLQAGFVAYAREQHRGRARKAAAAWLLDLLERSHGRGGFVSPADFTAVRQDPQICDGWVQVVLDVGFGDVARGGEEPLMSALANSCLRPFDRFGVSGWLVDQQWPDTEIEEVVGWLQGLTANPPRLPLALGPFADQLDKPIYMLETLVAAHPGFSVYAGYLMRGAGTTAQKRAVRAHLLAADLSRGGAPVSQHALWIAYRKRFDDIDACSSNDLRVAVADERGAPHLFILDTNRSVHPLGVVAQDSGLDLTPRFPSPAAEVLQGDAGRLHDWLAKHGPSTRDQIHAALAIPESSLIPMLSQRTSVINASPRHYFASWRSGELATLSWATADLVEDDAWDIVAARQCGEILPQLYAGWTGQFEHALCERADREEWAVLPQLLWACEPGQWPLASDIRTRWSDRKASAAMAPTMMPAFPVITRLPDAERLLRILLSAVHAGAMTPVRANRITRPRGPRELVNGVLIAMLSRVDALSRSADCFWAKHAVGPEAKRWLALLEAERVANGQLSWTRGVARRLLEESIAGCRDGWSETEAWTKLLSDLALDAGIEGVDIDLTEQAQADLVDDASVAASAEEEVQGEVDAIGAGRIAQQVGGSSARAALQIPALQPVEALIQLAQEGNADAQYQLSQQLERGEGVPANLQAALHWLRQAASSRHVGACVRLGTKLWRRELDADDPNGRSRALAYLTVGTGKGHAGACHLVGMAYLRGDVVNRNPGVAINLLKRSARAGHPRAAFELAQVLRSKMESWVPDTLGLLRYAASRNVAGARELLARAEDEVGR